MVDAVAEGDAEDIADDEGTAVDVNFEMYVVLRSNTLAPVEAAMDGFPVGPTTGAGLFTPLGKTLSGASKV